MKSIAHLFFDRVKHRRLTGCALLASLSLWCLAVPGASGAAVTLLYTFSAGQFSVTGAPPETNPDGIGPASKLVQGTNGYFYGTASTGGDYGTGDIFSLSESGSLSNLYSFPEITDTNGIPQYDFYPNDLALGTNGNLYGTTQGGGSNFSGTIFLVTPAGAFQNLYTFSPMNANFENADGGIPIGALAQGPDGNFYGVTQYGGLNGTGTIFQLTPAGGFTNLYSFSALNEDSTNSDGAIPNALVLEAGSGVFYGTTQAGGTVGSGAVFQFSPAGGLTPLYSFQSGRTNDPSLPNTALVEGPNGNFYGASTFGGSKSGGTVYEVTPAGGVTVLYSFPSSDDGASATLTLGSDGSFYGATSGDGTNGTGTLYKMTLAGAYTKLYSFPALNTNGDNTAGANPSAALLLGADGDLYGTCLEGGANGSGTIFRFSSSTFLPADLPPSISKQPPANLSALDGAAVTLSVTAKGAATLVYKWLKNGTNLSDGGDIADSSTSTLRISPLQSADAGTYSVLITNTYGKINSSNTKLTVLPDLVPPTVSITSPKPNARASSPLLSGTASDKARVTNVFFSLTNLFTGSNFTGSATLTNGTGAVSNWSIALPPLPGTNILSVESVNFSSLTSKVVSVTFFREAQSPLTVRILGGGGAKTTGKASVTGDKLPANGAMLNLGESYSITALPDQFSLFSNWVAGAAVSNSPTLKFIMNSNTVLTANVVSNFFRAASGTYNGLFFPTNSPNAAAEENSGMLYNLKLMNSGAYTATLFNDGQSYHLATNFDVAGHSALRAGQLRVDLTLESATLRITGAVSNTQWAANLTADFASNTLPSAQYTLLFSPSSQSSPISPPGDGYALVTDHLGAVTLTGALADGTSYSQKVPASQTGDLPIYASLYGKTGLLLGWINLTNIEAASLTNQLTWIKKPSRAPALYPNGFTNILTLQGSPWTNPPAKEPAISLTNGELFISNASPELVFAFTNVTVNNKDVVSGGNPARTLAGAINPKSGQLTLTFETTNKSTAKVYGAVLQNQPQNQPAAGGYFLTTTNAGSLILQAP